jgi:hypothetical protein
MTTPHILNFTIYGERCSGTTFLEEAITSNFNLPVMWYYDWKHFFGSYDFDADKKESEANGTGAPADNTLFIGIVRNPVRWLHSFSKRKQYIPSEIQTLGNFFQHEFYSVNENDEVIAEDVHLTTKERFKNIFELRKVKNDFLINEMPTKVQNYIFLTYEDLLNKYDETLDVIKNKFGLTQAHPEYVKIPNHTIDGTIFTGERELDFTPKIIQYIWDNVDTPQERLIGYERPSITPTPTPGVSKQANKPLHKPPPPPPPHPVQAPRSFKMALPNASAQPLLALFTPAPIAPIFIKPQPQPIRQAEIKPEQKKQPLPAPFSRIIQNTTSRPLAPHNQAPPPSRPTQTPSYPTPAHPTQSRTIGMGLGMRMNKR